MEYDSRFCAGGFERVCGVDEAGRGPLAGPVCVAAVVLPKEFDLPGLDDSKKLSPKRREELFEKIKQQALDFCIILVDEKTIDSVNILKATLQGMEQAVRGLKVKPELVLIDGNMAPELQYKTECVVKGDAKVSVIAAASVLAKVTRDRFMLELAKKYPGYGFEKHKGYGTKAHYEALRVLGPSEVHRKTFNLSAKGNW